MTCDTSLDANVQPHPSPGGFGGGATNPQASSHPDDHTLNTRSLMPGVPPTAAPGVGGQVRGFASSFPPENNHTAPYSPGVPMADSATAVSPHSPHAHTEPYSHSRQPAAPAGVAPPAESPSSPAMDAFEAAESASVPVIPKDEKYQVDFGGFEHSTGRSGPFQSVMVFLVLLVAVLGMGLLYVFVFSDDSDPSMAGKKKGPDLKTPAGRTRHLLSEAKTHIDQQRWAQAKTTLADAMKEAPNEELKGRARDLSARLTREKTSFDWFRRALAYDKKGKFSHAFAALKKVDPKTKLNAQAGLLKKRILKKKLPLAMQKAAALAKRKRYARAYKLYLQIQQVQPGYPKLKRKQWLVKRKLKRKLSKKKRKCYRYCRRRKRRRRRRNACRKRCREKAALPVLEPIVLKAAAKAPVRTRPAGRKPAARKGKSRKAICKARCSRRFKRCNRRCLKRRVSRCKRYYRRKYRRSRRRRLYYYRKKCRTTRRTYRRYCVRSRSRYACRRSYYRMRRCLRRCR